MYECIRVQYIYVNKHAYIIYIQTNKRLTCKEIYICEKEAATLTLSIANQYRMKMHKATTDEGKSRIMY